MNSSSKPKTQGRWLAFFMRHKMTTLVYWYILGTLVIVLLFAALYAWTGSVVDDDAGLQQPFWTCLYFSVTTHTTVGYGDLRPVGAFGRFLMGLHVILSTVYTVMFLGAVVAKALWPPDSIVVSPIVVFDYIEQKFRFRFYNAHRFPFCSTKYTVSLRGVGSSAEQLLYRNFRIAMQYPGHPLIESLRPWIINTKPCVATDATREKLDAATENILCPGHLKENSYLTLQIEGKYPGLGGQASLKVTRIQVRNIRCGRLSLVETIDTTGEIQVTDWRNFNNYTPVEPSLCQACQHHAECFLRRRPIGE